MNSLIRHSTFVLLEFLALIELADLYLKPETLKAAKYQTASGAR